jgi:DNA polymerase sigma
MSDISVKELCRQKLELHLKQTSFAKYTTSLHFIGGAMTRMGVKGSDLDLCLLVTQSQTINSYVIDWHTACAYLTKAQESIDRSVELKRLLNIKRTELRTGERARTRAHTHMDAGTVPILRLHIEDGHRPPTNIDINCNDMTSMRDAYLLRAYVDAHPLVGMDTVWIEM